jgi:hypothetical protein
MTIAARAGLLTSRTERIDVRRRAIESPWGCPVTVTLSNASTLMPYCDAVLRHGAPASSAHGRTQPDDSCRYQGQGRL